MLEPIQVAFYLAGEITQVIDSIPWQCLKCLPRLPRLPCLPFTHDNSKSSLLQLEAGKLFLRFIREYFRLPDRIKH